MFKDNLIYCAGEPQYRKGQYLEKLETSQWTFWSGWGKCSGLSPMKNSLLDSEICKYLIFVKLVWVWVQFSEVAEKNRVKFCSRCAGPSKTSADGCALRGKRYIFMHHTFYIVHFTWLEIFSFQLFLMFFSVNNIKPFSMKETVMDWELMVKFFS